MTSVDLEELERLAKAATPGPWKWSYSTNKHYPRFLETVDNSTVIGAEEYCGHAWVEANNEDDYAYIAAATPSTILSLITALRDARGKALPAGCVAVCILCGVPFTYENGDPGAVAICQGINPETGRDYVDGVIATCPIRAAKATPCGD